MRVNFSLFLILVFVLSQAQTLMAGQDQFVIGSDSVLPLSAKDQTGMLDLIVKNAFSRLKKEVQIIPLPSERSLLNANKGIIDGDLVRTDGMNQLYPNLVKVPETICSFDFIAFTKNKKISLPRQWESLKPYSVAIITGWKILEENVIARHVVKVDTPQMLFNHLDKERVDLIVYNRHEGYGVIHEMNFEHVFPVEPPLASRQMFLYLNKKHQVFVHEVAAAIRQMKEDGSFDEIVRHSLEAYIP